MNNLPASIGPLATPDQLIQEWARTIHLLDTYPEQQVAHTMASQALNAGHDEWRIGASPHPIIVQITEMLLDLETPDGSPHHRSRQWQIIRQLLD